ncbi:MAG: DUF1295 domain-containing protein [Lysobacterales bacterium]
MSERNNTQVIVAVTIAVVLGAAVSWAGSVGGDRFNNFPVFALCGVLAFAINWLVFIPSALGRTEHYYDLTGGLTYITVTVVAVTLSGELDLRGTLVAAMVLIWAVRLSSFLFRRISRDGSDVRFDGIRDQPMAFLMAWTLQGLWVLLTAAAALAVITGGTQVPLGIVGIVGLTVWATGMVIEIVADQQKSQFRKDPANKGKFIHTGLWAWSRHPNYFGEIVLWVGMAIVAVPVLTGWQHVTLISPIFVALLLAKGSGVPPLEAKADERWGGQPEYEAYKSQTPVLIMKPPSTS